MVELVAWTDRHAAHVRDHADTVGAAAPTTVQAGPAKMTVRDRETSRGCVAVPAIQAETRLIDAVLNVVEPVVLEGHIGVRDDTRSAGCRRACLTRSRKCH